MSNRVELLKNYSMAVLKSTLQYQTLTPENENSVWTMGHCMAGCGFPARGGGVCKYCIEQEIYAREREGK